MSTYRYFATAAKGLEEVLSGELTQLGMAQIEASQGGVAFRGSRADGYRACLWLRSANRVLQPLAEFECPSDEALYQGVADIGWEDHLTPEMTMAVDANLRDSHLTHSRYAALKAKDAIVDRLRDRLGKRPDIDPKTPDLRINIHIARNQCTVNLDLAGIGLHRRGYRQDTTLAPLRETLAAGIVQMTGWDGSTPFVDPMCGSGTLPIEAALLGTSTAPGLLAPNYSFSKWPGFDDQVWQDVLTEAEDARRDLSQGLVFGSDRDQRALAMARRNSENLPMADALQWQHESFSRLEPPAANGTLVCNPPYGERLGDQEQLALFYKLIGDTLKQRWTGWTAWVLTGNLPLSKRIGLKPSRRIVLFNGAIECRLLKYELY